MDFGALAKKMAGAAVDYLEKELNEKLNLDKHDGGEQAQQQQSQQPRPQSPPQQRHKQEDRPQQQAQQQHAAPRPAPSAGAGVPKPTEEELKDLKVGPPARQPLVL